MNNLAINRIILYCIGGMFMVSCSGTGEEKVSALEPKPSPKVETLHHVSMKKAKENVLNFVSLANKGTRASARKWAISDIQPVVNPYTRSTANGQEDTLLYIVNMADSAGFAIATADDRLPPILALADEGNYTFNRNDTVTSGFHLFMQAALNYCARQKELAQTRKNAPIEREIDPEAPKPPVRTPKFEVMKPLLHCKWGQDDPYNKYCSGNLTGCVITAAAQIMSFLETPNKLKSDPVFNEGEVIYLKWKLINEEARTDPEPISAETKDQIAYLMNHLGRMFRADYGKDATSTDTETAVLTMRHYYHCDGTDLLHYNCNNMIGDLRTHNKIIIMSGKSRFYHTWFVFPNYDGGHAWVVDGYIDYVPGWNIWEYFYLHCNWGWNGRYNGYFLDNVFNTDEGPVYNDNGEQTRSHFRFKLKYATFTKH